jgi:hypothetical protein
MSIEAAEREKFEAWAESRGATKANFETDTPLIRDWWTAWQARAALDTAAPAEPPGLLQRWLDHHEKSVDLGLEVMLSKPRFSEALAAIQKQEQELIADTKAAIYTAPPAPEAQALTDEQIADMWREAQIAWGNATRSYPSAETIFARAVEQAVRKP